MAAMHYVRQGDPLGLGHAVQRARMHVGDEPFAVLLGDDLIDARDELLSRMLDEQVKRDASIVALLEVDPDSIHLYGAAAIEPSEDPDVVRITGLVEKPAKDVAPSNYAVIGRYVLKPEVFDVLAETPPGKGGEIQLTDALMTMASGDGSGSGSGGVFGVVFRGRRYDTGDKLDYIKAVVQLAADRDDFGAELKSWLAEYVGSLDRR